MLIYIAIAAAAIFLLYIFALAPGHATRAQKEIFVGRNFAHRGLYEEDQSIPENSLAAFERAAKAGYGMELDVQLSRDGQVVVFHDDTLNRVCGVDSRVDALDYAGLRELRLCGTEERIPLFTEVLKVVDGRTPLIVELKNGPRNRELCEKTLAILKEYHGDYCIESFQPFITAWFRFHAPGIMRGFLSQMPEVYLKGGLSKAAGALLGRSLFNFAARPDFIAHQIGKKTVSTRIAEALGAVKTAWTSHDESAEKEYDIVIFEYYRPKIRFKEAISRC
ncbi:MAG: glycerophosphodiester phosphodiesterase [Lachnospiraceae bacterium]|nr:glycerophosphodiester phosphodiesterase [Lachnospiraceae bacterium]